MSLLDYVSNGTIWKLDGKCSDLSERAKNDEYAQWLQDSFFGEEEHDRFPAVQFCQGCPVKQECLRSAMESGELHGVWGGVDETERRRDLWISPTGKVGVRKTRPRCPSCRGEVTLYGSATIICNSCEFEWESISTAEGLRSIQKEGAKK